MTQQKLETELTEASIKHIETILQFLSHSTKYQHQTALIQKLQYMLDKVQEDLTHGNNRFTSKGTTAEVRTTEWLKIAVAYTNELKTRDGKPCSPQEKVHLINDCMKQVTTNITDVPEDVVRYTGSYLTDEDRIITTTSATFFKAILTTTDLLSAVFMGEEERAEKMVRAHPDLLFATGTYKMPLLNQDGTPSTESEQIYRDTTPLRLMLYTGDWKMWERIFPLIPEPRLEETLQEMRNISRGGPDLVKIDRDPTTLSVDELQHYHVTGDAGTPMYDSDGAPVLDDLLHNRNGLFYHELDNHDVQFFVVDIHPETQEKTVTEVPVPANMTAEDQAALNELQHDIHHNMPMNSSRRTSDAEHALIHRLFGVTLERNGIKYSLNGKDYQDTYDGCIRLKNAYRQYIDIANAHQEGTPWDAVDAAWVRGVGMAQRQAMVHVIQRFCEVNQPLYPLQNANDLQFRAFVRTSSFDNWVTDTSTVYPLRVGVDVGFNFGLFKRRGGGAYAARYVGRCVLTLAGDLAAVRLIDKVRQACFNERMHELEQRLHPSPGQASGPGCVVM